MPDVDAAGAARTLVEQYAVLVDAGDVDGVVALFAKDAILRTASATYDGRDAIREFYGDRLGGTKLHLVTDISVRPTGGGTVESSARYAAFVGSPTEPVFMWGRYEDRIEVDGGAARFQTRAITIDGSGPPEAAWSDLIESYRKDWS
jgi:3-phenylpropionate/cinnamic acid dioxygenase small subunit